MVVTLKEIIVYKQQCMYQWFRDFPVILNVFPGKLYRNYSKITMTKIIFLHSRMYLIIVDMEVEKPAFACETEIIYRFFNIFTCYANDC